MWKSKDISVKTKVHVYKLQSIGSAYSGVYGSEFWTLKKEDERKLHSLLEMNCLSLSQKNDRGLQKRQNTRRNKCH